MLEYADYEKTGLQSLKQLLLNQSIKLTEAQPEHVCWFEYKASLTFINEALNRDYFLTPGI